MTTQITKDANPRLPHPTAYRQYLDKILPDHPRRLLPRHLLLAALVCAGIGGACMACLYFIN